MEHKPLLAPGLHDLELNEIENYFLKGFPDSKTRQPLIDGLNSYIHQLSRVGIDIELWIDGSFTTHKKDPADIDLVLFFMESVVQTLPSEKQQLLKRLVLQRATMRKNFGCDVYFGLSDNSDHRSEWEEWYGFDRDKQPKGIARITVKP